MNNDYIHLSKIILNTVSNLSNKEIKNLIDKKGYLVYQEKVKKAKVINSSLEANALNDIVNKIETLENKDKASKYLEKMNKSELTLLAKHLNVKIVTRDKKAVIINKIVELILGLKLRRKLFDDINKKD